MNNITCYLHNLLKSVIFSSFFFNQGMFYNSGLGCLNKLEMTRLDKKHKCCGRRMVLWKAMGQGEACLVLFSHALKCLDGRSCDDWLREMACSVKHVCLL